MYKAKKLKYNYYSLEPYIDTHTLALHYNKHYKNYLDKLNLLLLKNNYDFRYSLEELSIHIDEFSLDDRNDILFNLGGVINHNIYFSSMSANKVEPNSLLMKKINDTFYNYDRFKKMFKEKALSLKGSGYTYLVLNKDNNLEIVNFSNQDNPYLYNLYPLIGFDMWEHAYYINYENKKDIYIDNFFDIIDFSSANNIFN